MVLSCSGVRVETVAAMASKAAFTGANTVKVPSDESSPKVKE